MSLNLLRLKHLVKGEHQVKKARKKIKEESSDDESVNKYDSEEEVHIDSDSDSENNNNSDGEDIQIDVDNETHNEQINNSEGYKNFTFNPSSFAYIDIDLVQSLNSLTTETQSLTNFLLNLEKKIFFEKNVENSKFFTFYFSFFLQKMFTIIKQNSINHEIISSFSLINKISSIIIDNNVQFINQNEKIEDVTLEICNSCIELYLLIISCQNIPMPNDFILSSLKYILDFLVEHKKKKLKLTQESYLKKYIETIYQLVSNLKQFNISFSLEEYKNIFSINFNILKRHEFSTIFVFVIEIICTIIELTDDNSFINKFIENLLLCFDEFLNRYDYGDENFKFYILNNHVLRHYKFFFGEYKCLNSESISLFTYLFLRFFSLLYLKEDFLQNFEKFLLKLFDWNNPNILLCLFCLLKDLLKIKYNVEFCISLILLTNFYLSLSNFIAQPDIELSKKKFFIHLLDFFFDDLLKDFESMKSSYLCFGISELNCTKIKKNKKKLQKLSKNRKCDCFSCQFTSSKKSDCFYCQECHWKTNLRLQLIDPDKDDNTSVCGFCNMKSFFELCGIIFEKEKELQLIETNEELIEEYSKSKISSLQEEESQKEIENRNLFDKFIYYQDIMYKNAFLFLKINLLNFIRVSNKIENKTISNNIDGSFKIFLKNLITDQKMKNAVYKNFTQSVIQFYTVQKERLFNLHQDILIDEETIKYFFFFHFYVNFLFAGHWKIIDIILTKGSHWGIKSKSLKILEKFILFEKNDIIFQNFDVNVISPLLCDSSFNIRELSLNILFKLYQNKKIERGNLIYILYENINESSFLIRKRIITALSDLVIEEKEREHLKTIILIFLNKLNDNSESEKIKKLICDYFIFSFKNNTKTKNELLFNTIETFIELLKETENILTGNNFICECIKNLFESIHGQINTNDICIDYLTQKYLFKEDTNILDIIQCLNLIKIFSYYDPQNTVIYIEYISNFLMFKKENENKNITNRIIQISCEILSNVFSESKEEMTINIKTYLVNKIEASLIYIILNKPIFVMISAIKSYFAMLKRGMIEIDKIANLTLQNFNFIEKIFNSKTIDLKKCPENIISKSLSLFSFVIYCFTEEQINLIFSNSKRKISNSKNIIDYLFEIFEFYTLYEPINTINFRAFESFGFFWNKFPKYLNKSNHLINFILEHLQNEDEKIILLRTFYNFFSKISAMCKENQKKLNSSSKEIIDFGIIHLFFDTFINKFSIFLIEETNPVIRTSTIHLLKLIIELGNLNVHNILPHVFSSLFDSNNEVRYTAVCMVEKIMKISKEKFFALMKECLKFSFVFQKNNFVSSKYLNSFVKEVVNEEDEVKLINTNENVFELLNYKICKANSIEIQKKFLEKFLNILNDNSSLESRFSNSSLGQIRECLENFEFYEFVAKLIGDFKFRKKADVFYALDRIYPEFETNFCVFKSKLKSFKESNEQKIDMKFIFQFLVTGLKIFLIRYLEIKYEIFTNEDVENIHLKGWTLFSSEYEIKSESVGKKSKKKNNPPKTFFMVQNEFKFLKFYEFFSIFEMYCKDLFSINSKKSKKNSQKEKNILIEELLLLKNFYSMKLTKIKDIIKQRKKKTNIAFHCYEQLFTLNKEDKENQRKSYINQKTNIKMRKRVTLLDKEDEDSTEISSNKENLYNEKSQRSKSKSKSKRKTMKRRIESKTEKKRKKRRTSIVLETSEDEI